MISETVPVFPNNIVNTIVEYIPRIDPDINMLRRPLRRTDPSQSVGVFGMLWSPDRETFEMGIPGGVHEATVQTYLISVQAFVVDFDEERGLATSSVLSTLIRTMLSRNPDLRVALRALSVSLEGSEERTRRFEVRTQRFNGNEIDGNYLYLSTLEFWLETEKM